MDTPHACPSRAASRAPPNRTGHLVLSALMLRDVEVNAALQQMWSGVRMGVWGGGGGYKRHSTGVGKKGGPGAGLHYVISAAK